jgi:hypothetical protein
METKDAEETYLSVDEYTDYDVFDDTPLPLPSPIQYDVIDVYSSIQDGGSSHVKSPFDSTTKPVLEDLPVETESGFSLEDNNFDAELDKLWSSTTEILKEFQERVSAEFNGMTVKLSDIREVLGKLVVRTCMNKSSPVLVSAFLEASRKDNFSKISQAFDTFMNQAERFARLIISELRESPMSRLVPHAQIGGIAGGSKFIAG